MTSPRSKPPSCDYASSTSESDRVRPKRLGGSHDASIAAPGLRSSTARCKRSSTNSDSGRDSSNFKAAQLLLQKRLDAGLSQEELAFLSGESSKQIGQRERGEVKLGALRALMVLERAIGVKKAKR